MANIPGIANLQQKSECHTEKEEDTGGDCDEKQGALRFVNAGTSLLLWFLNCLRFAN